MKRFRCDKVQGKKDLHLVDEMFSNFDKMSRNEKFKGYGLINTLEKENKISLF